MKKMLAVSILMAAAGAATAQDVKPGNAADGANKAAMWKPPSVKAR